MHHVVGHDLLRDHFFDVAIEEGALFRRIDGLLHLGALVETRLQRFLQEEPLPRVVLEERRFPAGALVLLAQLQVERVVEHVELRLRDHFAVDLGDDFVLRHRRRRLLRDERQRSAGNEEEEGETVRSPHAGDEREPRTTDSTGGSRYRLFLPVENL